MAEKTPRIKLPAAVRQYVLERDNHCCQSCQQQFLDRQLQIDHIMPLALGGSNDLSNLQTLCSDCNRQKGYHLDPRFKPHFSD